MCLAEVRDEAVLWPWRPWMPCWAVWLFIHRQQSLIKIIILKRLFREPGCPWLLNSSFLAMQTPSPHRMLLENTVARAPSWKSLILCKSELGPGHLHFPNLFTCSHHSRGLVTSEAQRGKGICPRSPSQTVAKGAFWTRSVWPSTFTHFICSLLWTSSFLQFYFPLNVRIWAVAGSTRPVLPSPPRSKPQRSGTSQPPAGMSIYGSVVPKCGQICKLPLPRDTKQFVQSAVRGQSWELRPRPGLQPGPRPNELWRWMGPRPSLGLSFSTYRAKELD